ncbi:MAG: ABC transporter ATP-binding protein [Chloroflexi bacterium]|nr:ABC transporter ATP-binding protein [Chloroflexota bacterium]
MFELVNIVKKFEDRTILDIPYLSFRENKRYVLMGVNGSGKTTLLRIMAGTLEPDMGEVKNIPREDMGYMPQSPYAFGFSVRRNVEMALPQSPSSAEKAMRALKAVGMDAMADARGHTLSGGETQRMAFARMIALPRTLLLLDEPTSSADIQGMDQIEATLLRYAADTGCTLILSTHSPAQALRLAEEIIFLDKGKIVEQGTAQSVLRNPQNEDVKLFLKHWKI